MLGRIWRGQATEGIFPVERDNLTSETSQPRNRLPQKISMKSKEERKRAEITYSRWNFMINTAASFAFRLISKSIVWNTILGHRSRLNILAKFGEARFSRGDFSVKFLRVAFLQVENTLRYGELSFPSARTKRNSALLIDTFHQYLRKQIHERPLKTVPRNTELGHLDSLPSTAGARTFISQNNIDKIHVFFAKCTF